jgi:serine/threonine protein kinase
MDATGPRSLHLVHCGGMRCVYRIPGTALEPDYVLKILKLERTNETVMYRFARKDAVAMERLSSSPYALDMYVMCSLSKVLEYSSGGNIHDLMKRTRVAEKVGGGNDLRVQVGDELAGYVSASETTSDKITTSDMLKEEDEDEIEMDETVNNTTEEEFVIVEDEHRHSSPVQYQRHQTTTPLTKLKIAFQVATAVADMHAIEAHPDGLPAMVSNDLCCHQFVLVNGVYKLSDFDYTTLITVRSVEPKSQSMNATRRNSDPSLRGTGPTTLSHPKEETCQTTPFKGWGAFKILPPEHLPYLDSMATHRRIYRDKLDIWQIGNIMYLILTNSYVWEGIDSAPAMLATYHVRFFVDT